jgi:hypothetical protein
MGRGSGGFLTRVYNLGHYPGLGSPLRKASSARISHPPCVPPNHPSNHPFRRPLRAGILRGSGLSLVRFMA